MRTRALLVVLLVLVGGCGSDEPDGSLLPPLTVAEYCSQELVARCPALVACGVHVDLASCVDAYRGGDCPAYAASVADGRMAFDGEAARDCVLERQADTSCPPGHTTIEACGRVFSGLTPVGDACTGTGDCDAGGYCAGLEVQCPGRCAPRKALGAAATRYDGCEDGLYPYAGACRRPVERGGACAAFGDEYGKQRCTDGSVCDDSDTCVPWRGTGESCGQGVGACGGSDCFGGRCQRQRRLGEACDLPGSLYGRCADGLDCDGERYEESFCVVPRGLGEPCSHGRCGDGLWCRGETCAPLPVAGEPCDDWDRRCGAGLFCSDGVCEVLPAPDACHQRTAP